MGVDVGNSHYAAVAALGEESVNDVIPNGDTWVVRRFIGAGAFIDDAHVCLVWDQGGAGETILRATHGDMDLREIEHRLTGDGTKKLALVLTNDTNSERALGASWEGRDET